MYLTILDGGNESSLAKMVPIRALLIIGSLASILLIGCTAPCQSTTPSAATGKDVNRVDMSLTTDLPCELPCWQGIVIGQSKKSELLSTLSNLPFVDTGSVTQESQCFTNQDCIYWNTALSTNWDGRVIGRARLNESQTVQELMIILEYEVDVQKLLDKLGPPDHFGIRYGTPGCYPVHLLWLDEGVEAYIRLVRGDEDTPLISADSLVEYVFLFAPAQTIDDYLVSTRNLSSQDAKVIAEEYADWQGLDTVKVSTIYGSHP